MRRFLFVILAVAGGLSLIPMPVEAAIDTFHWVAQPMQSGEIANIVVSPSNPDIMYLGVEVNAHSVYKSVDRGKSWQRIDSGDHSKDVAVHPTNPDIAFYADSQSLWRTTTGGKETLVADTCNPGREKCAESFQKVIDNTYAAGPSRTSFSSIAIAPSNPDIVYASIRGAQGGGPFAQATAGGQLFRSTDGGSSFTELSGSYPTILTLFVDPISADHLLVGSDNGIYASTDGGQTVAVITQSHRDISSIDSLDGQTYLAASTGSGGGVIRSMDGGVTWSKTVTGLPDPTVFRVRIVHDQPTVVWATTRGGVARSTDGGQSWEAVNGNLPATNVKALTVDPTNPNLALVATETHVFDVQYPQFFQKGQYYRQGIYRTEDGGQTWTRSDTGLLEEKVIEITAHPTRPYEVWAGQQSSRGMYRSRDAGQSWSLSPGTLTHYPMRTVFIPGNDDGVVQTSLHTGEDFGITTDDGVTWTTLAEQTFFQSLSDQGKELYDDSLNQNSNLHLHGLAVDPTHPKIMYVGSVHDTSPYNSKPLSGAHIFKSTDGGATWMESDTGFEHHAQTAIHDIEVAPSDSQVLYVATTRDESQVGNGIWKSGDAGATWSRVNTGLPNDVSAEVIVLDPHDAKRLLVGTMQGLYLSTNGGSSWTRLRSEEIWDVEADPTNPETVYAGGLEGIYQSHDFGATWTNVSADLPEGRVRSLAVNSTGEIVYAAVDGYGLYGAVSPSVGSIPLDEGTTATSENNYRGLMVEQLGHTTETSTDLATSFKDSPTTRRFLLIAGSATGGLLLLLVVVGVVAHRYRKKIAVDSPRD